MNNNCLSIIKDFRLSEVFASYIFEAFENEKKERKEKKKDTRFKNYTSGEIRDILEYSSYIKENARIIRLAYDSFLYASEKKEIAEIKDAKAETMPKIAEELKIYGNRLDFYIPANKFIQVNGKGLKTGVLRKTLADYLEDLSRFFASYYFDKSFLLEEGENLEELENIDFEEEE